MLVVCRRRQPAAGRLRARAGGSEGGHNGLRSIAEHLGTTEYRAAAHGRGPRRYDGATWRTTCWPGSSPTNVRDRRRDRPGRRCRRSCGSPTGLANGDEHVQSRWKTNAGDVARHAPCRLSVRGRPDVQKEAHEHCTSVRTRLYRSTRHHRGRAGRTAHAGRRQSSNALAAPSKGPRTGAAASSPTKSAVSARASTSSK